MRSIFLIFIVFFVQGCSVGKYQNSQDASRYTLPVSNSGKEASGFLSMGTITPITPALALTAAHVAKGANMNIKAIHPDCDIALVYFTSDKTQYLSLRTPIIDEAVKYYGYSFAVSPKESVGKAVVENSTVLPWNKATCELIGSDAGVVEGMSGGAVINSTDYTLAGIIVGYAEYIKSDKGEKIISSPSLFVPYSSFKMWLDEEMKKEPRDLP